MQPPISGEEIIDIFDIKPSKEIGILKTAIKEAILDGIIANEKDEAYQFLIKKAAEIGLKPKN
jgi:tRNA nucleotidyltransferase (CCA-adding enzyme)